jgi:hypothetical protein
VTNAPWYINNRQIREDLGIPFFADLFRAMTESFNSKLANVGNPSSATWMALVPTKGWLKSPTGNQGGLMLSRPANAVPKMSVRSAKRVVSNYLAAVTEIFHAFPQL